MKIRHILFDLDGTLLPMHQKEFVTFYMPLLAKMYRKNGAKTEPGELIAAVWSGYKAMVKNDGSGTNREVFWQYVENMLPFPREEAERLALEFYGGDFNQAAQATMPTPYANQVVKAAKEKGIKVYLATNPVFPRCATLNRIRWAGLDADDFEVITTYEECRYCKPDLRYFQGILKQFALEPKECLMVGNDVEEDMAIRKLGVSAFLVTDTMENEKGLPIEADYQGTMKELYAFVQGLDEVET